MRKVKFRLQPVLAHRKRVEEKLQMELASLSREYLREEQALPLLKRSLEWQIGEVSRLQGAALLDLAAIELGLAALGRTEASIEQQQALLKRLSEEMGGKREELIQAMKKCKALDKLKEKQQARALAEERRADAKSSDEIGRALYHRKHYLGSGVAGAG